LLTEPQFQGIYSGGVIRGDDSPLRGTNALLVWMGFVPDAQRDGHLVEVKRLTRVGIYARHEVVDYPVAVHLALFMAERLASAERSQPAIRHANNSIGVTPTRLWLWLWLWYPVAERLPSADRSQPTHHTAGRHRDSAARLCSGFLVLRSSGRRQFEAAMNSRRLPYLLCSFHPRRPELARQPHAMELAADTTLFAMHAAAILQLSCSRVALLRDDR
jgi:hypothetical protein